MMIALRFAVWLVWAIATDVVATLVVRWFA